MDHWNHNRRVGIALSKTLGNTNTDDDIARRLLAWIIDWEHITPTTTFLEPAVGAGSFVFAIIDGLLAKGYDITTICKTQIYAADVDPNAIKTFQDNARQKYGEAANHIQVACRDFLTSEEPLPGYDWIVTNPPYVSDRNIAPPTGWTKEPWLEAVKKRLSSPTGSRADLYALFHARALDLLNPGGKAVFLCSDSWLDTGFGEALATRFLEGRWTLETVLNSQLLPFFRDDTNAILTVIRKLNDNEPYDSTAVLNWRAQTWDETQTYTPDWWSHERLKSTLQSPSIPNKRNAFLLFPKEYEKTETYWQKHENAFVSLDKEATLYVSPLGASAFDKDPLGRANRGPVPVFWQLQGRSNRPADYRTFIPSKDLTLWVDSLETLHKGKPVPLLDKALYLSTIIDRFPLVFYTDVPTLPVSKYIALLPKTQKPLSHFATRLESIPSVLSLEQRMKEGTRKTLRIGEKGLAKEITKNDLTFAILPKTCDLTPVSTAIADYQSRILANLETALEDPMYWTVQCHLAKNLGYIESLLDMTKMATYLYVLRMRNLAKLKDFDAWYTQTHANRLQTWTYTTTG